MFFHAVKEVASAIPVERGHEEAAGRSPVRRSQAIGGRRCSSKGGAGSASRSRAGALPDTAEGDVVRRSASIAPPLLRQEQLP
jgi:hypothetical protein